MNAVILAPEPHESLRSMKGSYIHAATDVRQMYRGSRSVSKASTIKAPGLHATARGVSDSSIAREQSLRRNENASSLVSRSQALESIVFGSYVSPGNSGSFLKQNTCCVDNSPDKPETLSREASIELEGGSKERPRVKKAGSSGITSKANVIGLRASGSRTEGLDEQGSISGHASQEGLDDRLRTAQLNVDIQGELLGDVGGHTELSKDAIFEGNIGVIQSPDLTQLSDERVKSEPGSSATVREEVKSGGQLSSFANDRAGGTTADDSQQGASSAPTVADPAVHAFATNSYGSGQKQPVRERKAMGFQVVTVSPTKKQMIDRHLVKAFKGKQEEDYRTWRGLNVKFTSRPGVGDSANQAGLGATSSTAGHAQMIGGPITVTLGNVRQVYIPQGQSQSNQYGVHLQTIGPGLAASNVDRDQPEVVANNFLEEQRQYFKIEDARMKQMADLMLRYREWEEERIKLQLTQGPGASGITGNSLGTLATSNLLGNNREESEGNDRQLLPSIENYGPSSAQQQMANINSSLKSEFITFKPLKDSSILIRDGQSTLYFQKGAIFNNQYNASQENGSEMYFKLVKCETKLVRAVLENNAWQGTETHDWNLLWSSQPYKNYIYDNMSDYQKVNHFPHSDELTRKDRLCVNIVRMQEKHGKEAFDIIPDTYNLPDEFADFYQHFHSNKQKIDSGSAARDSNQWIVKPVNSCQGRGIFIVDEISEVPIDEPLIASRYLASPLLINGLKFDIRLYVLLTCMDPWRVYIFNEGLVRFASEEYDATNIKTNKFAHLTNYSINKKNEKYIQNSNAEQGDEGHKWSLTALSKHLEQMGVDMELLWSKIYDVIIKSLISVDGHIQTQLRKTAQNRGTNANCFELLGFDIMLDQNLKPWLLEVNISPSLGCDSPLDLKIKHSLFIDTLNLACLRRFDRRRENLNKMKQRAKNISRTKAHQTRQATSVAAAQRQQVSDTLSNGGHSSSGQHPRHVSLQNPMILEKLQKLQPKIKDALRETLQENFRRGGFIRIFPSRNSNIYDRYFAPSQSHLQATPSAQNFGGQQAVLQHQSQPSRMSNKILHKLMFSDELVPYPLKRFQKTFSKYQVIYATRDAMAESEDKVTASVAGPASRTPAKLHPSKMLSDDIASHKDGYSATAKKADGNVPSLHTNFSQSAGPKHSKLNKVLSGIDRLPGTQVNPNLSLKDTVSRKPSHLSATPQIHQYMGKRGERHLPAAADQQTSPLLPALSTKQDMGSSKKTRDTGKDKKDKLLITGDDILIEYVARLMIAVKSIKENMLKAQWIYQIEKFIKHTVWHSSDTRRAANNKLWQRLESRLIEMKERRKRLLQSLYNKELKSLIEGQGFEMSSNHAPCFGTNRQNLQAELDQFQREYKFREEQKNVIIQGFSAQQLEEMLYKSTKNVAYEVISCLITVDNTNAGLGSLSSQLNGGRGPVATGQKVCKGVLTDIIKWLTMTNQQQMLNNFEVSILEHKKAKTKLAGPGKKPSTKTASTSMKRRLRDLGE